MNRVKYIDAAGGVIVKNGQGTIKRIIVGQTSGGAAKIYDSVGVGGTQIAELKASIAEGCYDFDCIFATGLYIETAGASKLTIIYS